MRLVPTYRPRSSPLHAARAGVAASFCVALALAGGALRQPDRARLGARRDAARRRRGARSARELWLSVRLALPFALLVAIVNPLVYQGGETLLVRGPVILGHRFDITLEAFVQGGLNGLRVAAIIVAFGLLSAAVDPDELLRLFRRLSYRSALTASLATRLVPVLARDALRRGDAARCRPEPPGRLAMTRLVLAGALDRAVDVAAALEVRGYALAGRPASAQPPAGRATTCASRSRRRRSWWSRSWRKAAGRGRRRLLSDDRRSTSARATLALAAALPLLALAAVRRAGGADGGGRG